ncbi:uncharacterized protein N7473_003707 [Penicillium subrubescens]|uniref:uncharacterized protein n=1 Tax=Penicillium subrubescens TaxID=1316194 RepID=UPI0025457FE2|nr:uncharacterized protein N7473_003707 [Penicillium subrubescens]KAJ5906791.1 hypothetical protein N7473_003707 [Penicillium subrubescens]
MPGAIYPPPDSNIRTLDDGHPGLQKIRKPLDLYNAARSSAAKTSPVGQLGQTQAVNMILQAWQIPAHENRRYICACLRDSRGCVPQVQNLQKRLAGVRFLI